MLKNHRTEQGATAMIVVLFSTLLFIVITVGFMNLMVQDQRASIDTELSRGAYDAALSGVEDGKRVLQKCADGDADACKTVADYQTTSACDIVSAVGIAHADATTNEVNLQSVVSSGSSGLDYQQAYTCVRIQPNTNDYLGTLSTDQSILVPLRTVGPVNKATVMWYTQANAGQNTIKLTSTGDVSLPTVSSWGPTTSPPMLRVELIQYEKGSLNVTDLDNDNGAHTLYLYPKQVPFLEYAFSRDGRRSGTLVPLAASCNTTFIGNGGYACRTTLDLPPLPSGGDISQRVAYLRITAMYGGTDFSVTPLMDAANVMFDGVQPIIDSTGRAADLFRRVSARVERTDPLESMLMPRATVDMTGNLCKTLTVGDTPSDYIPGAC